jgi:DNA-binding PadR family transcriptional regulator
MKLTKARIGMMDQLAREPGSYASYYPPLKWLLENGLAHKTEGKYRDRYELTDAGRNALAEANQQSRDSA